MREKRWQKIKAFFPLIFRPCATGQHRQFRLCWPSFAPLASRLLSLLLLSLSLSLPPTTRGWRLREPWVRKIPQSRSFPSRIRRRKVHPVANWPALLSRPPLSILTSPPQPLLSPSLSQPRHKTTGALFGAAATAAHYNDVDLFAGLRAILQLLLLPRSDGGGGGGGKPSSSSSSSSAPSADIERLSRLVERLALDFAAKTAGAATIVSGGKHQQQQQQQRQRDATTTLAAAALLLCVARSSLPPAALRRLRAALSSLLPATRAALDAAVSSLAGSVEALGGKLAAARAHLSRRADEVDAAVESLTKQAAETARLVEGVAASVEGVDVNVLSLKVDVGSAKEGVALLCRVVADLIRGGGAGSADGASGRRGRPQGRAAAAALVAELDSFARDASRGLPFTNRRRVPGFEAAMEEFGGGGGVPFDFGSSGTRSSGDEGVGVDSCSSSGSGIGSNHAGGLFLCRRATGRAAGLAGDCFK